MVRIGVVLALAFSLSCAAVPRSKWANAYAAQTLRRLVIDTGMRMAVVGMGEAPDAVEIATAAGEKLVDTPGIDFVLQACPGLEPNHSDLQAVSRCHRAGANYILVVRVFPGTPARAVLTVYDRDGETVAAVSVEQGVFSFPDRSELEENDGDVSEDVVRAVLSIRPEVVRSWKKERCWSDEDATRGGPY